MNTSNTHFKGVTGNFVEPVTMVSAVYSTAALASAALTILNLNTTALGAATASLYTSPVDLLLEAVDFQVPAGGGTSTGTMSMVLTHGSNFLGAWTAFITTADTVVTRPSYLTRINSTSWYRALAKDLVADTTKINATHKGLFLPAGETLVAPAVAVSMDSGTFSGNKVVQMRFIFKNVHEQGITAASLAI